MLPPSGTPGPRFLLRLALPLALMGAAQGLLVGAEAGEWWSRLEGSPLRMTWRQGALGAKEAWLQNGASVPVSARLWWTQLEACQAQPWGTVVVGPGQEAQVGALRLEGGQARWRYRYRYSLGRPGVRPVPGAWGLPFSPFRRVRVMQGPHGAFSHRDKAAYDFELPEGAWVLAARPGVVVRLHRWASTGGIGPSFLGELAVNSVLVAHADGTMGYYAHFKPEGVAVQVGAQVALGDRLGQAGATGYASGPHLHFEVNAAGPEAQTLSFQVPFRTAAQPQGAWLQGGEWVEAP